MRDIKGTDRRYAMSLRFSPAENLMLERMAMVNKRSKTAQIKYWIQENYMREFPNGYKQIQEAA